MGRIKNYTAMEKVNYQQRTFANECTPQTAEPSNEQMLIVLNKLCEVRHSLNKAKLSDMEQEAIFCNLDALQSNIEVLFVERIREDFPL